VPATLAQVQPAHGRVHDRMGAALHQPHQADLRERSLPAAACGPSERRQVGGRVRHVQGGAVQCQQPPPAIPPPLRLAGGQRPGDLGEQRPQRRWPQPCPGAGDRALVRDLPAASPASGPRQPLDQQPHDLLVAHLSEQAHGQGVVGDHAGGQQPLALLGPAGIGDHPIHQLGWEGLGQHPDRDPIRQARCDRWLGLADTRHRRVITSGHRTLPGARVLVGAATTSTVAIRSGRGDRQQATAGHSMGGCGPLHSDGGVRDEGGRSARLDHRHDPPPARR
jgi:hypothetical protein